MGDYNGYTNWATWFVSNELQNDVEWYKATQRLVRLEAPVEEFQKLAEQSLFPSTADTEYGEMSRREFGDVDWDELRTAFLS